MKTNGANKNNLSGQSPSTIKYVRVSTLEQLENYSVSIQQAGAPRCLDILKGQEVIVGGRALDR